MKREVRAGVARAALNKIALYPEFRNCAAPSTERILEIFAPATRHHLRRDDTLVQTFQPELTASNYTSSSYSPYPPPPTHNARK